MSQLLTLYSPTHKWNLLTGLLNSYKSIKLKCQCRLSLGEGRGLGVFVMYYLYYYFIYSS